MVPDAAVLRARRLCRSKYICETSGTALCDRRGTTYGGQLSFLSGDGTQIFFADSAAARSGRALAAGEWTLATGGNRKAVWTRSGVCAGAEPRHQECAAGKSDLSDRPLSGQRNCAEHHGLPLRQCYFRAHLEPALHRPCSNHECRNRGRGTAWRVLLHSTDTARHGFDSHNAATHLDPTVVTR